MGNQSEAMDFPEVCEMTEAVRAQQSSNATEISDLITGIARALVDCPDNVSVQAIVSEDGTTLRLQVAQSDVGKIIGKQGRTARSLRTILSAASMKVHHRYSLDIIDNSIAS
ncbi:MAG: KH domain-containing protein [Granulicella sp.]